MVEIQSSNGATPNIDLAESLMLSLLKNADLGGDAVASLVGAELQVAIGGLTVEEALQQAMHTLCALLQIGFAVACMTDSPAESISEAAARFRH